ncbi:MAG: HAMP domain-containing sensor histidine kinase, partial [Melioribacteraceae bacterium]|nr:HAMP domain-containing sensor histidine kinase [Melioribacteraceae bacterium]
NTQRKKKNSALGAAKKEIELINNNLNVKNEELEQLNSTKDKFFSIIAHDLKNPFNTLLGASQILKLDDGGNSEEDKKELIDIIANDTEKLYNLLENLLFWSRSQTGNLKAKVVDINLQATIFEIANLYKSSYNKKNISVDINIPKEFVVRFDEFMFNTIIRNLLSNAIKFSYYDGKILFSAKEEDNKIHLQIADSGMGIKEENISKLFDESSDYNRLGTDNEKGTGLGLILCRDFAAENGATINVTSKIDKGTTFELVSKKVEEK